MTLCGRFYDLKGGRDEIEMDEFRPLDHARADRTAEER